MKKLLLMVAGALVCIESVSACCMVPRTYKGSIGQSMQEAVVLHADGREELVLGIKYQMKPGKDGKLPPYFAWVITVPNEPDRYQLADRDLFKKVFDWGDPKMRRRPFSDSRGPREKIALGGLIWSKQVTVGPYTIQPVKATGMAALKGLNVWLDENGFPQEDEKHMEYFVKNGFTFLCIKVSPAKASASVPGGGSLKPLHLSFKSKQPYYPLRFSSRQGVFGINVWLMIKDKIDYKKAATVYQKVGARSPVNSKGELDPFQRFNVAVTQQKCPKALSALMKNSPSSVIRNQTTWNLNLIKSAQVNKRVKISSWNQDVFLPLAGIVRSE